MAVVLGLRNACCFELRDTVRAMNIATYMAKNPNISFVPSNISGNLLNLNV